MTYRVSNTEDGDEIYTYAELEAANADDAELLSAVRGLEIGGTLEVGGGAAVAYVVTRLT